MPSTRNDSVATNSSTGSYKERASAMFHDFNEKSDKVLQKLHLQPNRPKMQSPAVLGFPGQVQLGY